jgi:prolyl-tRNA editing enzyme YbaK/EbsC (Cys-tRNA(Pro) deacylase)
MEQRIKSVRFEMETRLPESARRVQEFLETRGMNSAVVELPDSTRTAADAARAIGCEVAHIAKSLVFRAARTGRSILVIASGANRVDEDAVARLVAEPIEKASPEFVRERTGYAIGGVPPVAHVHEPVVFIDQDLQAYSEIWAAAGTSRTVFRIAPKKLIEVTGGQVIPVAGKKRH